MTDDEKYLVDMAKDLLEIGKPEQALITLLPLVNAPETSPGILWFAGHIAVLARHNATAVEILERARHQAPHSTEVIVDLIQALFALRRFDEASAIGHASLPLVNHPVPVLSPLAMLDLIRLSPDSARMLLEHPDAADAPEGKAAVRATLAVHDGDWTTARTAGLEMLACPAVDEDLNDDAGTIDLPPHYRGDAPRTPPPAGTGIVVATSLSPRGGVAQRQATATWSGFADRLISVNCPEEIDALAPDYPEFHFVASDRDGRAFAGKPLTHIDSLLDALEADGAAICGIVNADIRLLDAPRLRAEALDTATSALTLCHRLDLDPAEAQDGLEYLTGFDAFFFPRSRIPLFRGSALMLGAPWWDYLLPMLALIDDLPIRIPWTASIGHVLHPINWSLPLYNAAGHLWIEALTARIAANPAAPPVAREFLAPVLAAFVARHDLHGAPKACGAYDRAELKQSFDALLSLSNHLVRTQAQRIRSPRPRAG
jgi:hypothetical protein